MADYKVTVVTGTMASAGTFNKLSIKLVGTKAESDHSQLVNPNGGFFPGASDSFTVSCPASLGELLVLEVEQKLDDDDDVPVGSAWFCSTVAVVTPEKDTAYFPVYRWVTDQEKHRFREGKARRVFEDEHPLAIQCRSDQLKSRANEYCWFVHGEGIPHGVKAKNPLSLPHEVQFSFTKDLHFRWTLVAALAELNLKGYVDSTEPWDNIEDISKVFSFNKTPLSEYVHEHWKEDEFFGYQFLNGVNPMIIQRCSKLPENFPVTDDMVRPALQGSCSLTKEMEEGNIFLVDYQRLDGLTANTIHGKQQYLAAPLVLLHKTPDDKLMPIAIQLKQKPGNDNPIFLPTDSEYDWLMAKTFVRSADFSEHQLSVHLLRTHLLCEVFAVALLRNLPSVHPLFKLLIPHTRYTLQIDVMGRSLLISDDGVFTKFAASGGEGMFTILRRSLSSFRYSSLCMPEDIAARGLESVPNFYYREDGLKLWDIVHGFVEGVIGHYYKSDSEVQQDSELQNWINDIFVHGFLSESSTGVPQSLTTVAELVKIFTVVIFTGSGQHSAVNGGQFDYGGWMPNTPISLQLPPPSSKGHCNESLFLRTLSDVGTTVQGMSVMWLLSRRSTDFVPLGEYPEEYFSEDVPCRLIKEFQDLLKVFSKSIKTRNASLKVPYTYLDPAVVENSVAI